ncbi:MAG: PfkB family carbohydrate kinase [Ancrocorticia sp.]|uniref:PfkB family carbohydrate kinase n=2 Tax=Ancrocorticia sp. TaxID=2593684 RepID=UPI003F90E2A1
MATTPEAPVLCLGEALIDVVHRGGSSTEHVGGSPLNVACGLAALGHSTELAAWWANDPRGKAIEELLAKNNVRAVSGSNQAEKTAVAMAYLDDQGRATYEFDLEWKVPSLPAPAEISHLHTGSFAATLAPGGNDVLRAVKAQSIVGTVSYDPNARPNLMGSPADVVGRIEEIIAVTDVLKASDEDIEWLYGKDTPVEDVMRRWLSMGPAMVVVTRGPWGAYARLKNERDMLVIDPLNVELADTVGAGDSFMSGMLSALLDAGLLGSADAKTRLRKASWGDIVPALHRATMTSGLTVSHNGAYAPNRDEIARVLAANPLLG